MEKVVNKKSLKDKKTDFAYWQSKPEVDRLAAIETLRQQYIKFKFGNVQPRFQRVCSIVPLKQSWNLFLQIILSIKNKKASGRHQDLGDIENLQ